MGAIRESLGNRRIVICVGAGGTGKTTVAAALALQRALDGGRALVCTIDPAQRLANAMGLDALGNFEAHVPPHKLAAAGLAPRGQLYAMVLDVKRAWDDLVMRSARDRSSRDRILRNRFHQQLSSALAGSQEYMAVDKLYELATERDYDLVVLDTPPTRHALDLLEAPDRIVDFLGNDAARRLLAPAMSRDGLGLRIARLGGSYIAKTLARFTGRDLLDDLVEFLESFDGMVEGLEARATAVRKLLTDQRLGFVIVATPSSPSVDEALLLHERLHFESIPIAGIVANRMTLSLWPAGGPLPGPRELAAALSERSESADGSLPARLARALEENEVLARAHQHEIERLTAVSRAPLCTIPRLDGDIHDLAGLGRLAAWL